MPLRVAGLVAVLTLSGCFSAPTPLAPGLRGSVGMPNQGVQTDAVELPMRGSGFARYRPQGKNHWGQAHLVSALTRIAAEMEAELPGAPLVIGDLAAKSGGKIPGHASHRSGRDVDLLFYTLTPGGAPVQSPGFVRFEGDGLAVVPGRAQYVRLDVPRNWLLVKKLLIDQEIAVQFLFVSKQLEALIMDYARSRGEPLELLYRAQTVMLQPGDSLPHDDHFHLRIACVPEQSHAGCSGGGPYWEWLPTTSSADEPDESWLLRVASEEPFEEDSSAPVASSAPGGGGA